MAKNIGVIGLGYVGLPLAVAFSKCANVVGFDINSKRVERLNMGIDDTKEVERGDLVAAQTLKITSDVDLLKSCDMYIVTVPTPVDASKKPDLTPILKATELIGGVLKAGDYVVYESTVYPGVTEDVCAPLLEKISGLTLNVDFFLGYSPERINPGDKENTLEKITKVTSGSTEEAASFIDALYAKIITAGTYKATSIKVAEAAKVIENTQRDLNIALMNELSLIFDKVGIDTSDVLDAAATKWNFLRFQPGLVGGHCIGVDPYYLTHKAQELDYHPEVILAGRRINDAMGAHVAQACFKQLLKSGSSISRDTKVLVLGMTFKENCPDLRNTKVIDVVTELQETGVNVDVFDPIALAQDAQSEYGIELLDQPELGCYDAIILAVPHREFLDLGAVNLRSYGRSGAPLLDIKAALSKEQSDWRL